MLTTPEIAAPSDGWGNCICRCPPLVWALACSTLFHGVLMLLPAGQSGATVATSLLLSVQLRSAPVQDASPVAAVALPLLKPHLRDHVMPAMPALETEPVPDGGGKDNQSTGAPVPLPLGVPLPRYFERNEVTQAARLQGDIELGSVAMPGIEAGGKVAFSLYVNERGEVDRGEIDVSGVPDSLAAFVLKTFLRARFQPAEIDGVPVKTRVRIEVEVASLFEMLKETERRLP